MSTLQYLSNEVNFNQKNVTFYPGSDWLYFKLYINPGMIDTVINTIIQSVCNNFESKMNQFPEFFFLRYNDYGYHLRIRFKVNSPEEIGTLITSMNNEAIKSSKIKKVVIDTYLRESDRYGLANMDRIEKIFCIDSIIVSKFLNSESQSYVKDDSRFSFAVANIIHYLSSFQLTEEDKLEYTKIAKQNFHAEFKVDDFLRKKLNNKFRDLYITLVEHIKVFDYHHVDYVKRSILCEEIKQLSLKTSELRPIIWSVVHMHVNRIFNKEQRFYELLIYDFLEKFYRKEIGISKNLSIAN